MNKHTVVKVAFQALLALLVLVVVGANLLLHREVGALRVIPSEQNLTSLFGNGVSEYTPLGSKQGYIVLDRNAFFQEGDMVLLNQTYLDEHGLYPLQGRTVRLVRNVSLGFVVLMVLMHAVLFKNGVRQAKNRQAEQHLT